ncbi:MAG: hypothetical protein ACRD3W_18070, partial [Terriglobales bacterium]
TIVTKLAPSNTGRDADGRIIDVKYQDGSRMKFDWEGEGDKSKISKITDAQGNVYERGEDGTFLIDGSKVDCTLAPDGTFQMTKLSETASQGSKPGSSVPDATFNKPQPATPEPGADSVRQDPNGADANVDPNHTDTVTPAPPADAVTPTPAADAVTPTPAAAPEAVVPLAVQVAGHSYEAVGTTAGGVVIKNPGVFAEHTGSIYTGKDALARQYDQFTIKVDGQDKTVYRMKQGLPQLFEATPEGNGIRLRVLSDYEVIRPSDIQSVKPLSSPAVGTEQPNADPNNFDFRDNVPEQQGNGPAAAPNDVVASSGDFGKSASGGEILTTSVPNGEAGLRPDENKSLTPEEIARLEKRIADDPTIDADLKRRAVSALELARDPAN